MNDAADLLRKLRDDAVVPACDPAASEARRAKMVPWLEGAIALRAEEAQRTKRRRALGFGALAAAAVLTLGFGGAMRWLRDATPTESADGVAATTAATSDPVAAGPSPEVSAAPILERAAKLVRGEGLLVDEQPAVADASLVEKSRLRTATRDARVALPNGAFVDVARATSVELFDLAADHSDIVLAEGRVELTVPKLAPGAKLTVHTDAGFVLVHGTRFVVTAGRAVEGPWMSVEVLEGEVSVHELVAGIDTERARLRSGEHYRTPRPIPAQTSATPSTATASAPVARTPESELREQNTAFSEAMQAKARGDHAAVVTKLTKFLARWPDAPLAPEARSELERARKAAKQEHSPL